MNLEINYDGVRVDDVSLTPDESENVDVLYNYSRNLLVKNPAVDFSERVKSGEFNAYSDDEYDRLLNRMKFFSKSFFCNQMYQNIFQLAASSMKYILQYDSNLEDYYNQMVVDGLIDPGNKLDAQTRHLLSRYYNPEKFSTVSSLMELYNLNHFERDSIYSKICNSRHLYFEDQDVEYIVCSIGQVDYFIPAEDLTACIDAGDKTVLFTFYNPFGENACVDYGTEYDDAQYQIDEAEEIAKNTVMIRYDENYIASEMEQLLDRDKPILWYNFVQKEFRDCFEYMGRLKYRGVNTHMTYDFCEDEPIYIFDRIPDKEETK